MAPSIVTPEASVALLAAATGQTAMSLHMPIDGHRVAVRMRPDAPVAAKQARNRLQGIAITIDGAACEILAPRQLLMKIFAVTLGDNAGEHLNPKQAALLLEALAADTLDTIERTLGVSITIDAADPPGTIRDATSQADTQFTDLVFDVAWPGQQAEAVICRLPTDIVLRAIEHWFSTAGGALDPDHAFDVRVRVGSSTLTEQQLRAISPGDVVVLSGSRLGRGQVELIAEHTVSLPVDIAGPSPILTDSFQCVGSATLKRRLGLPSEAIAPDRFRLDVDLAHSTATLAMLASLEVGGELDLPTGIDGPVTIFIGDLEVGSGRLVRSGSELGVMFDRVSADG
jgi:flagellar motor switch/type III secretory pathway protein FliN